MMDNLIVNDGGLVDDMLALKSGDMQTLLEHVDGNYDTSADYWKVLSDGTIEYDGSGWLTNEKGDYVDKGGNVVDEKNRIGANVIEVGLLNINKGTGGVEYKDFTDDEINTARTMMQGLSSVPAWRELRYVTDRENNDFNLIMGDVTDLTSILIVDGEVTQQEVHDAAASVGLDFNTALPSGTDVNAKINDAINSSDAMSLPTDTIYMDAATKNNAWKALLIHEMYQQKDYSNAGTAVATIFGGFVAEQYATLGGTNAYTYGSLGAITSLSDITTAEGRSLYVQEFASSLYSGSASAAYFQALYKPIPGYYDFFDKVGVNKP